MSSTADGRTGWEEATIAWANCASIHREYAKGQDALFSTRQADYVKHENHAREMLQREVNDQRRAAAKTGIVIVANEPGDVLDFLLQHLREQASMRRRQAGRSVTKTDKLSHTRLAENLDFIATQLSNATIRKE